MLETTSITAHGVVRITDAMLLDDDSTLSPQRELARRVQGPWRGAVIRSALAVELLCTRHPARSPPRRRTSLPEAIGGERNWDYHYCWIRDSAFRLAALLALGCAPEADAFSGGCRMPRSSRARGFRCSTGSTAPTGRRSEPWRSADTAAPAPEAIRTFIESRCWSPDRGSYVRFAGTEELDAALLLGAPLATLPTTPGA